MPKMPYLMLHKVTYRALAIAACGGLLACDASALSLGRARGAVLLGRPLEITVPVTLDRQETDVPCVAADLFYGEQKVGRPPSIQWEPGAGVQGNLRIISAVPVDEPMVIVYVRVGCAQSSSRRYVLLSELPPEGETALPIVRSAPAASRQAP
ncbi:MAG: hypothetical protein JWP22_1294, partial [Ramlibacter sp.]|nr:hypothetical protein [Ramlibacter sp.]